MDCTWTGETIIGDLPLYKPTISIVVPVYNGGENFAQCLSALTQASPPADEIIVVSDGAGDGSAQLAETFGARVIKTRSRRGAAHARNTGARAAQGEIVFFVDADVVICSDATSQIMAAFKQTPVLAATFGSYDDAPAAPDFLSQYRNLLHHYTHQTAREEASTFWSGCGAIRRDVFTALGGFNEGYHRPAIEDIELGYRLKQAGHRIWLCKTLQVKHLKRWETATLLKADFVYRALPWTDLILRYGQFINDLNLKTSSRISVILTFTLVGALAGAWWWAGLLALAGIAISLLLALNAPFYRFLLGKRGLRFALKAIPWHWLYYFYSGLAFALGVARYALDRQRRLWPSASEEQEKLAHIESQEL